MQIVILSGGSGKRLWPLSNEVRSKQFIKILKKEDGEYESMVQRVYSSIRRVDSDAGITIATSKTQVSSIQNQLGNQVDICVEPCRRDTFPAIVLAGAYLKYVKGISDDEAVVVCPVDPYVNDDYFETLSEIGRQAQIGDSNLTLMGIEPTYPSEKYGYILTDGDKVTGFREKPDLETAKKYLEQRALWNGGVFGFKLGYLMNIAHNMIEFKDFEDLRSNYESLIKISFDYAVVEKESNIKAVRFNGQWKDIGTWNTLTEAMTENTMGKVLMSENCENVHIINELDIPVLCMGLKDAVVAAGPDGILVSDKGESSYMKTYVDTLTGPIMYAEKSWGSYKVIDVENDSITLKVTLLPGHKMNYHSHKCRNEVWTVVEGTGTAVVDDEQMTVTVGDVISLPAECKHTIFAHTELKLIEVQSGVDISVSDKKEEYLDPALVDFKTRQ